MELEKSKISSYYAKSSKRSFLFFRLSVGISMLLLLVVLTINLYYVNPNQTTDVRSRAAGNSSNTKALPSLPAGCQYKTATDGSSFVACVELPSPTPTPTPQLPSNCRYETSGDEYIIRCSK